MSQPTDRAIIDAGVKLLEAGLLPSLLPGRLMLEYQLTRDRAARLAQQALQAHKEQAGRDITR
jgi:hypothetical protein